MDDFNTHTRLRNACDACHKLKRRCTGTMPCENCASLGSSCFYSMAGRLGRPRGSKNRRTVASTKSPPSQKSQQPISDNNNSTISAFSGVLNLNLNSFEPKPSYKPSTSSAHSPESLIDLFSTSEVDTLPNLYAISIWTTPV